jgi:hypothetical protein
MPGLHQVTESSEHESGFGVRDQTQKFALPIDFPEKYALSVTEARAIWPFLFYSTLITWPKQGRSAPNAWHSQQASFCMYATYL